MEGLQLFLDNFADWDSFVRIWPLLWQGLQLTVLLSIVTLPIAAAAGLLIAILYSFHNKPVNVALLVWIDLFRSFPVLVLLILIFYGLPFVGLKLPSFAACVLALGAVLAAFATEIFWAAIQAVPQGQWDAARSLGMGFLRILFLIILPQAIRIAVPLLTNRAIAITKGTALGTAVSLPELLGRAQSSMAIAANPSPLTLAAAFYLLFFVPLVVASRWLEGLGSPKASRGHR